MLSLHECLEEAKLLLEDETATIELLPAVIESLLQSTIRFASPPSHVPLPDVLKAVSVFICDCSVMNPHLCVIYLNYLRNLPPSLCFLDIIPTMFVLVDASLMEDLLHTLLEMVDCNNNLIVPVLGILVDLQLPRHVILKVAKLADLSIRFVDRNDFPTLLRTLFKTLDSIDLESSVITIRNELRSLSPNILILVVEVMYKVLPVQRRVANAYLNLILQEHSRDLSNVSTRFDHSY